MTPAQIEAQLRSDLDAFDQAATTQDRLAAIRAWMVDASMILVAAANQLDDISDDSDQARAAFRKLQRQLLLRRVIWNPRLLETLTD